MGTSLSPVARLDQTKTCNHLPMILRCEDGDLCSGLPSCSKPGSWPTYSSDAYQGPRNLGPTFAVCVRGGVGECMQCGRPR